MTLYLLSLLLGLVFGSFANVCILRLPKDESISVPASHCPGCGTPLRAIDNIPLISFLILKGRCRSCRRPISWQYPIVEGLMGLLFLMATYFFWGAWGKVIILDVLAFYLVTISIIDYHHRIIPDELSLSLIVLGWLIAWVNPYLEGTGASRLLQSVLAALAGGGAMLFLAWLGEKIFKQEALGGGDIKLIAAFGALLGWQGLIGSLLFGSLAGGIAAGGLILMGKKGRKDTLPFGPFLSFGVFLAAVLPSRWLVFLFP
jgi:leader peptidase (prepilin peptidase)/N-methyltransferase